MSNNFNSFNDLSPEQALYQRFLIAAQSLIKLYKTGREENDLAYVNGYKEGLNYLSKVIKGINIRQIRSPNSGSKPYINANEILTLLPHFEGKEIENFQFEGDNEDVETEFKSGLIRLAKELRETENGIVDFKRRRRARERDDDEESIC